MLVCIGGCEKHENKSNVNKEESYLKIRAGYMCGWGAGEDSLYISNTVIRYVYFVPARSRLPKINKTRTTTEAEWANILHSLDLNNFVKLDYNSCNICVDGCDEWIKIQDDQIPISSAFAGLRHNIPAFAQPGVWQFAITTESATAKLLFFIQPHYL
jgi:hypothetical protein